jgi:hypothetical protein
MGMTALLAVIIMVAAGAAFAILGAHGIVVYSSKLEALFKNPQKLFLEIEVPEAFRGTIEWMSLKGIQSWIIPAVFIAIGVVFWVLAGKISSVKKQQ